MTISQTMVHVPTYMYIYTVPSFDYRAQNIHEEIWKMSLPLQYHDMCSLHIHVCGTKCRDVTLALIEQNTNVQNSRNNDVMVVTQAQTYIICTVRI